MTPEDRLQQFDVKPSSVNYKTNRDMLSYRMSELVFGSLLASFILGFVATSNDHATLDWIAKSISSSTPPKFVQPNIWAEFAHRLMISVTYTVYTAFVYVAYQQNILLMNLLPQHTVFDFLVAIGIGFLFGISMYYAQPLPWLAPWLLACCNVGATARGRLALSKFHKHVVTQIDGKLPEAPSGVAEGSSGVEKTEEQDKKLQRKKREIEDQFSKAVRASNHPILMHWALPRGGWLGRALPHWCWLGRALHDLFSSPLGFSILLAVVLPLIPTYFLVFHQRAKIYLRFWQEIPPWCWSVLLGAMFVFFVCKLWQSVKNVPNIETETRKLDDELAKALEATLHNLNPQGEQ